jgi:putative hydrolase of the HAD superfamily
MTPAPRKPRAVLLDLWGTLVTADIFDPPRGLATVLSLAENRGGVAPEKFQELGGRIISTVEPLEEGSGLEFSEQSLLRILSDSFGLKFRHSWAELEWVFWSSSMTIYAKDGAGAAISELVRRGIRTCVVSNSSFTSRTIERELSRLGLLPHIGFVASSADYGIRKPNGILFDVALRRLGVEPQEAWFVGDDILYDVEGPWDAGIQPVLYETKGGVPPRVTRFYVISHWKEFIPLVDRAGVGST